MKKKIAISYFTIWSLFFTNPIFTQQQSNIRLPDLPVFIDSPYSTKAIRLPQGYKKVKSAEMGLVRIIIQQIYNQRP